MKFANGSSSSRTDATDVSTATKLLRTSHKKYEKKGNKIRYVLLTSASAYLCVILLKCALTLRNEESVLKGLLLKKTLLFFVSPSEKKKSCLLFLLVIIIIIVETLCSRCCALGALKRLLLRARAVAAEAFLFFPTLIVRLLRKRERGRREREFCGETRRMLWRRRFLSRRRTTLTVSKFEGTNARTGKSPWFCKRERNI